jgi:hypothetical protein
MVHPRRKLKQRNRMRTPTQHLNIPAHTQDTRVQQPVSRLFERLCSIAITEDIDHNGIGIDHVTRAELSELFERPISIVGSSSVTPLPRYDATSVRHLQILDELLTAIRNSFTLIAEMRLAGYDVEPPISIDGTPSIIFAEHFMGHFHPIATKRKSLVKALRNPLRQILVRVGFSGVWGKLIISESKMNWLLRKPQDNPFPIKSKNWYAADDVIVVDAN